MFTFNALFVAILVAALAIVSCKREIIEVKNVTKNSVDSNLATMPISTQLKSTKSVSGDGIYTFKCIVGTYYSSKYYIVVNLFFSKITMNFLI